MKTLLAALTVAAVVALAPAADAQVIARPVLIDFPLRRTPARLIPYSYFAAFPEPARQYVGFGNDFPFYGRPYGHPYDRWTWQYLGNANVEALTSYDYPPVP